MSIADVDGWTVWSDEPEQVVLAYRPDVFDGDEFPSPCLPTLYVTRGQRDRRPGRGRVGTEWSVTLYLEPDVEAATETCESREAAMEAAADLAAQFAAGEVDYRDRYQVPRPAYFDRLDALTGADADREADH